jgi:phosphatidylglycerophosphate synthase
VDILMRERRGYNVVPAMGWGLVATAVVGMAASMAAGLSPSYPVAATLACMALMTVVACAQDDHPFPRFGAANYVTMFRAVVMALVAGLIGESGSAQLVWFTIGIVALVAVLDGADGWLARRSGMKSGFGARFDMETDAALILVLSVLVWRHGKAGGWILMCGLMRYVFVAAGWLLPWLAAPLRSTRRGKTVAVIQYIGLSIALAPIIMPPLSAAVAAVTLAALAWSFAVDVMWLRREAGPRSSRHDA